jgi:thymidylate synthase
MSLKYLDGELDFYISGSPYLKDIVKHSKFWEKVTDDDRTVNSNYGKLLLHDRNYRNYTQFEYARDMLLQNKESKKAVMIVYNKENSHKSNDNPCTMYLHVFIREDKLDLFVAMRSSDIWYGMPYDVPFFVYIQCKLLQELQNHPDGYPEISLGTYNHRSGSLHMYKRNKEQLQKVFDFEVDYNEDQTELFEKHILSRLKEKTE